MKKLLSLAFTALLLRPAMAHVARPNPDLPPRPGGEHHFFEKMRHRVEAETVRFLSKRGMSGRAAREGLIASSAVLVFGTLLTLILGPSIGGVMLILGFFGILIFGMLAIAKGNVGQKHTMPTQKRRIWQGVGLFMLGFVCSWLAMLSFFAAFFTPPALGWFLVGLALGLYVLAVWLFATSFKKLAPKSKKIWRVVGGVLLSSIGFLVVFAQVLIFLLIYL